jgi:hypothetical protein
MATLDYPHAAPHIEAHLSACGAPHRSAQSLS